MSEQQELNELGDALRYVGYVYGLTDMTEALSAYLTKARTNIITLEEVVAIIKDLVDDAGRNEHGIAARGA